MRPLRANAAGAVFAAAAVAMSTVAAQDGASLAPVVVSATGLPLTETAINQRVQVFTREQIEAHPPASVADFLARRAGLMVDRRGRHGGYAALFLRGADPSHVVVLIDGVRQNDPLSSRGSAVDLGTLTLDDIERIEVVSGNTSVVHGEALAGVVQLFTRTPSSRSSRVVAEAGGDGLASAAAALSGPAWRVGASVRRDGEEALGRWRNRSANLGFQRRFGPTHARADLRLSDSRSSSFPDDSGGFRHAVIREMEHMAADTAQAALQLRHALGDDKLLEARIARFERRTSSDTPGVAPGLRDPFGLPPIQQEGDYRRTDVHLSALLLRPEWETTLGLQRQQEHGSSHSVLFLGAPVPADFERDRQTTAAFGEWRRRWRTWSVHAGLRVEWSPGEERTEHPALGVQWQLPKDRGRLGFALSSASKLPSFFALGHPFVGNPLLRAESTRQVEAYYQYGRPAGPHLRLTVFQARFRDLVDFEPGPPPRLVNRARIRSSGIELDTRHELGPVAARLQATWLELQQPQEEPLRHRPRHQLAVGLEAPLGGSWRGALDWVHIGRRWDSSIPTGGRWLAGFGEMQLSLQHRVKQWVFYAAVDNVLGTRAEDTIGTPVGDRRLRVGVRAQL